MSVDIDFARGLIVRLEDVLILLAACFPGSDHVLDGFHGVATHSF